MEINYSNELFLENTKYNSTGVENSKTGLYVADFETSKVNNSDNDVFVYFDIDSMYDSLDERLSDLELCNMFNEDGDDMACSLTITAGAGGTEAQDWARMLMRMYDMYCKAHGFSFTVTAFTEGVICS